MLYPHLRFGIFSLQTSIIKLHANVVNKIPAISSEERGAFIKKRNISCKMCVKAIIHFVENEMCSVILFVPRLV